MLGNVSSVGRPWRVLLKRMLVRIVVLAGALLEMSPPASAQQDWLGVFVGAQIGYSSDRIGVSGSPLAEVDGHNRVGSIIGGLHGGVHLLQQGAFIAGLVGDLNLLNANMTRTSAQLTTSVIDICGDGCLVETLTDTSVRVSVRIDWKASLRGKAGFLATPDLLVYATAGIAFAGIKIDAAQMQTVSVVPPPPPPVTTALTSSERAVVLGYVAGIGAEMRLAPNIGMFAQVLRYEFESHTAGMIGSRIRLELDETVISTGITFYLN